jgi:hypothetical protein
VRALLCCTPQFAKTEGPFSCRRDPAYRRVDGVWGAHQTTSLSSRPLSNSTVSDSCPNSRSAANCERNEITNTLQSWCCVAFVGVGMSDGRRPTGLPPFLSPHSDATRNISETPARYSATCQSNRRSNHAGLWPICRTRFVFFPGEESPPGDLRVPLQCIS